MRHQRIVVSGRQGRIQWRLGAVLFVEGSGADATLRGLFSERDLLRRVVAPSLDPDTTSVASVMTKEPVTVEPGTHVRQCAELIRERGFRHLPVVKDGSPIGILSARDFQQDVVKELEAFIDQAHYREELAEGRDPYDHFGGTYSRERLAVATWIASRHTCQP